jgi:hypothetical protein
VGNTVTAAGTLTPLTPTKPSLFSQYSWLEENPVLVTQVNVMLSRPRRRVRLPTGWSAEGGRDVVVALRVVVDHPGRQRNRRVGPSISVMKCGNADSRARMRPKS